MMHKMHTYRCAAKGGAAHGKVPPAAHGGQKSGTCKPLISLKRHIGGTIPGFKVPGAAHAAPTLEGCRCPPAPPREFGRR